MILPGRVGRIPAHPPGNRQQITQFEGYPVDLSNWSRFRPQFGAQSLPSQDHACARTRVGEVRQGKERSPEDSAGVMDDASWGVAHASRATWHLASPAAEAMRRTSARELAMDSTTATTDNPRRRPLPELERRLRELDDHARGLERELAQQRSELAWSSDRLVAEVYQRHELVVDAESARKFDAASGLPNRASFVRCLEELLAQPAQSGEPAALIVVGIDRLSHVRESLGFAMADQVARVIGERLRQAVQGSAQVARVGDDEFALVLTKLRVSPDVAAVARRLIEVVDRPMREGEHDLRMMATIGIALSPQNGTQPEMLLARAQAAMRFARDNGTRLYQFFSAAIGQSAARRLRLESELRRAIDRSEFTVHYQPRCRLRGRRVSGVEALLRWNHPERGTIAAGEFIDVAEETGLITPIGDAVLRQACSDAAQWPDQVGLSVNLCTREFRGARLDSMVHRALADSGLHPGRFLIELTEASLLGAIGDADVTLARLAALRQSGVRVVLDNFGTGACSLDLLRRCRAEYVKIDSQLIRRLNVDADVLAIVRAIVALARHFGAGVIAEGIEDPAQLAAALRAGCLEGQGYHLGRPVTARQMSALLAPRRGAAAAKASAALAGP